MSNLLLDDFPSKQNCGDTVPKQKAAVEQEAQKLDELIKRHVNAAVVKRDSKANILFLYMGFVGLVVAVGTLASYVFHRSWAEVFFIAAVILLLPIPLVVIGYMLRIFFGSKSVSLNEYLLGFSRSRPANWLLKPRNKHVAMIFIAVSAIYHLAEGIRVFPDFPRLSLVRILSAVLAISAIIVLILSECIAGEFERLNERERENSNFVMNLAKSIMGIETIGVAYDHSVLQLIEKLAKHVAMPDCGDDPDDSSGPNINPS